MPPHHCKPHTKDARARISAAKLGKPLLTKRRKPKIVDGVELWYCPTCKHYYPRTSFYPNKRAWNGLTNQCRACHIKGNLATRDKEKHKKANREWMRRARHQDPDKFRKREREASKRRVKDHRFHARKMVHHALKMGLLIKPSTCSQCSRAVKLTAHHPDHFQPLNVVWLCYECHGNK